MPETELRPTILVVDDEENILNSLRRQLRNEFAVLTAASGQAALTEIRSRAVDIILTDERMPELTGSALLAQATRDCPDAIQIILTGYADLESVVVALNSGQVYRYLVKPWNPDELLATLREASAQHTRIAGERQQRQALIAANAELARQVRTRAAEAAEANAQLSQLDQFKDELLAITSRDLRFPLVNIQLAVALLADPTQTLTPEAKAELLDTLSAGAYGLVEAVNDLLDLAQREAGPARLYAQPLRVSEAVRQAIQDLAYYARAKHIDVRLMIEPDERPIRADRLKLLRVFHHLLGNAFKFTPAGGWVLVVVQPEAGGVRVSVSDTGVGIPVRDFPELFRKRAAPLTPAGEPGAWRGLVMAHQWVELHGGSIEVSSVVGVGSTFTLHLPDLQPSRRRQDAPDQGAAAEGEAEAAC